MNPKNRRRAPRARLTFEQVRSFAAVASREHISDAADALGLSQATVSEQVHGLERALGVDLLQRMGRGVRVTDAGRDVQQLAIPMLDSLRAIEAMADEHTASPRGPVRLGAGHVLAAHRLAGWLGSFVADNPHADVEISLGGRGELLERLRGGAIDVVVLTGAAARHDDLETIVLEKTELVLVVAASHPMAHDPGADRRRHRHLAHEHGSGTEVLTRGLVGEEQAADRVLELEEGALMAALRAGLGWTAMPRAVIDVDLASRALVIIPHGGPTVIQRFCAVRRPGPCGHLEKLLWSHLTRFAERVAVTEGYSPA
ncbi:MAG: LysR family transcriptional regulator [Candidatus Dormibacteria bacterium]